MPKFKDLTGLKINNLLVLGQGDFIYDKNNHRLVTWDCQCICGKIFNVRASNLKNKGGTKSCGCVNNKKHGMCKTKTYNSWNGCIQRCTNPKHHKYKAYGLMGIKVCDRWLSSFENFYEDMGECPEGMTLDRIDNSKDYEPSNCRWASKSIQQYNRKQLKNKSGLKGIYWDEKRRKWQAYINCKGVRINLGRYSNKEEAVKVRKEAELKYFSFNV